jgi:hypothetical protein
MYVLSHTVEFRRESVQKETAVRLDFSSQQYTPGLTGYIVMLNQIH